MKGEIQGWLFLVEVNLCGIKLRKLLSKFLNNSTAEYSLDSQRYSEVRV